MLPEEEPEVVRYVDIDEAAVRGKKKLPDVTLTHTLSPCSQWREKQKELIAQRDAESEAKKQETIQRAREEIDRFYEEYNEKKQKAIEENRSVKAEKGGEGRVGFGYA